MIPPLPASATAPRPPRRGRSSASRTTPSPPSSRTTPWPNITGRSIIAGIDAPGQGELLKPFTKRYFEAILELWARRSSEVAQSVVIGLYPHWDISDDGIAAADEFLSAPESEVPPALRRLVLEGQAAVKRSLRARTFDAAVD